MKRILIVASLMAAAGMASAQSTSVPATEPSVAGQASTQTPAGVPNPPQRPDGSVPNTRANVRAEAVVHNKTPANSNTPGGEASTTRNHQPNATELTSQMTRGEVRQETLKVRPRFGDHKGERPTVPTNPKDSTGTPQ
jgi:hypothetical protein